MGLVSCLLIVFLASVLKVNGSTKPNFIIIFGDDLGFDFQCYGHSAQEWGPVDRMAEEGMRFTHWYSADSMCTPSRAALLTGRLPIRSGMVGPNRVLWQWDEGGLPKQEITIAEDLLTLGYSTGMVGKWHLGINENVANDGNHLPFHHGFQYVGTNYPYGQNWRCDPSKMSIEEMAVKCFKYQNSTMVQQPINLEHSTEEMVNDTKEFIKANKDRPFFFYMSLLQTHCSLFCSSNFCGKSKRGLYGDNVNEMAWAVGEVLDALKKNKLEENTLVFFLSDHGPHLEMCSHGGSSGYFKGGKGSVWEGGLRVPSIAWWPGTIPAGTVSESVVSTLDIYPTILHLAGKDVCNSEGVYRDGKNILDVLNDQNSTSPHQFLFHYCSDKLMAVHYQSYKIYYYTQTINMNLTSLCVEGIPKDDVLSNLACDGESVVYHDPPLIFNVDEDPGENHPLKPDGFQELLAVVNGGVEKHKATIVEVPSQLGLKNEEIQPCCNPPICTCNYEESANGHRNEL